MGHLIFPTGTTKFLPEKTWSGYTLFNARNEGAILIDMNGQVVHEWKDLQGFPNKMIKGGKVFGSLRCRDTTESYQDYADLTEIDWNGNILWSFDHNQKVNDKDTGDTWVARQHHDYQFEGNPVGYYDPTQETNDNFQKILVLTHNNVTKPKISPYRLLEDVLIEIDRDGNKLWTWHLLDHFNELNLNNIQKNAIFHNPNIQPASQEGDLFHVNCASYLGPNKWFEHGDRRFKPNNIIMDSREAMIMWIVDHDTGKIVWQIGPDYTLNDSLRKLGPLVGMHHSHMIPQGLPGAGNILVFNNGGWAGYGLPNQTSSTGLKTTRVDGSKVMEFDPTTLEIKWTFSSQDLGFKTPFHSTSFYSPLVSNSQRLPNGNTLINEGTSGRFLEVTPKKEVVWEYVFPYNQDYLIYRAYRIPYDWIPQLTKPKEEAVIPPKNEDFHLPGAADPSFNSEKTVSIPGTAGYGKPAPDKIND